MVQPWVNAFGNQAMTTACLPRYSDNLCVLPSVPCSEKSGAISPTFTTVGTAGAAPGGACARTAPTAKLAISPIVNSARMNLPPRNRVRLANVRDDGPVNKDTSIPLGTGGFRGRKTGRSANGRQKLVQRSLDAFPAETAGNRFDDPTSEGRISAAQAQRFHHDKHSILLFDEVCECVGPPEVTAVAP